MTDEHEDFLAREQQLFMAQLRQIIAEAKYMILDTSSWFNNLIKDFNGSLGDAATNRVRENWDILRNYYGEHERRLLQSLDSMVPELASSKCYREVGICTAIFRAHDQCQEIPHPVTDQALQRLEQLRFQHLQQRHEGLRSP